MENMHILFPALTLEIRVPHTTLAVNILTGYPITHTYCKINNNSDDEHTQCEGVPFFVTNLDNNYTSEEISNQHHIVGLLMSLGINSTCYYSF